MFMQGINGDSSISGCISCSSDSSMIQDEAVAVKAAVTVAAAAAASTLQTMVSMKQKQKCITGEATVLLGHRVD